MIKKGTWKGLYKYNNKIHHELRREGTKFEISIIEINNDHFAGTVQDDLATGGTEGIGEITGHVTGNEVYFVKQMPIMTTLNPINGARKTFNKKHPNIYYTGTFSDDGKSISGQWRFKAGFTLVGLLLIIGLANKGTWTMTLTE
ncbi:hypothetical protein [Mucilaginibacter sp. BT774]|uniref:hypothetical protein n=1 Tax=Mucilaginibacter sp. BT774 TaxID=3062276 RepID=UPI002676D06A|nr:hypothetical protein [Mucilaginibacter sp. BT774]MDO3628706.1 hypothetical protein [Mucilaginibacter sp. BT774]